MHKIRLGSGLTPVLLLTAALLMVINLVPDISALRIVLGLPFILFFPGYALVMALFPRRDALDGLERLGLSFGLSLAVTALLGFGLNYTPWGISLMPVLYAQAGFIVLMSGIFFFRQAKLNTGERFRIEINLGAASGTGVWDKVMSVILVLSILGTIGVLIYTISFPKVGERFTEFYLLGRDSQAAGYPDRFTMESGLVVAVAYGEDAPRPGSLGVLKIGIINREQAVTSYEVQVVIDGQNVPVYVDGALLGILGPITINHDETYEHEIGFAPLKPGDNQKVEFVLLVDGQPYFADPVHLWIDVS